jgi:hypothetical protein
MTIQTLTSLLFPDQADPPQAAYVDPSERVAAERDKAKADSIVTWVVSVRQPLALRLLDPPKLLD